MAKVAPIVVVIAVQFVFGSSDRSSCSYDDGPLLVKGNVLKFSLRDDFAYQNI